MLQLLQNCGKARRGRLTTARGVIETPAFMPVGTQGSVKGVSPRELHELRAQIILGNTYHLFVRPGLDVLRHFGGLHKFMNWNGPILTYRWYDVSDMFYYVYLDPQGVVQRAHPGMEFLNAPNDQRRWFFMADAR